MTGQILLHAAWREAGSHDRFVLRLAEADPVESLTGRQVAQSGESPPSRDGVETGSEPTFVVFRDIRKFGRVELTRGAPAARVAGLGPDAWLGEWDAAYLNARLSGRKAPLKAFLLDQRHLAGIGNIYADEILFAAGLSPLRQAGALTYAESERLANVIRERLSEGVRARGCSISDFVDTKERRGSFQEVLRAYGRAGEACVQCGGRLVRTVVAGRGTSHCPVCQT
jgi:formamidopyrimidine-DNA glycosylase